MQGDLFAKKRRDSLVFFALLIAITCVSIVITKYDVEKGFTSIPKAISWAFSNFYPNEKSLEKLPDILLKLKETVLISVAAASVASLFALLFAIFGSETTGINGFMRKITRGIATLFRNIDVSAWAMILLFSFGQSALTGYFALFFGSFGFLTRAFTEAIDEISSSSVEALQATGASYFAIIFQSVIPTCLPQIISWVLFMIETNIRSATLVGILTGTGIGFAFNLYYKNLNYHTASLVVIVVVVAIMIIENLSNYIRRVIL
ncbi:ABC transporter permease [uncultured Brevibacillus sp.]|uniref:PhnE/PtxC family ABC transporter permease n=1 Tax=uncultured Brevibacillus sp. TaxID=169970 RepID=UPI0025964E45|nr:ABC transporter permease subunit [uncultured Brevibacillus sp.]